MKRTTIILISLFILVFGIGCAFSADLNSHSIVEKIDSGDHNVHKAIVSSERPGIFTSNPDERLQSSRNRTISVSNPDERLQSSRNRTISVPNPNERLQSGGDVPIGWIIDGGDIPSYKDPNNNTNLG
ncbi:hypothetical protein [uncultured Methanobrevibacter sp.]|uniref:hypothetical protein n=1 Tax=uncultured Methanobrevibacter sp. TaxID=253161 RepID=UPI0025F8709B|nr:hypothetical protein [uncultured Methanobrevibacter sp.]